MSEVLAAARASLDAALPATIATVDADGMPNVTYISKVLYVDDAHVALTNQFFRKTLANLEHNPEALVMVVDPVDGSQYQLSLRFEGSREDGPAFDRLKLELETVATMFGMQHVFRLKSALLFRVLDCVHLPAMAGDPGA